MDAIVTSLQHQKAIGEVFNAASGQPVTIKSIIEQVVSLVGTGNPQFGEIPYRSGENMKLYANSSKIKETLGWQPKINMSEGLKNTIDWYERQN